MLNLSHSKFQTPRPSTSSSTLKSTPSQLASSFRSGRLSLGGRVVDLVAVVDDQKSDGNFAFREHANTNNAKVFSIIDKAEKDVKYIGTEDKPGDGFDYVLAFVNKTTKEVEFRPTSMIKFEPKFQPNIEALVGPKEKPKQKFEQDFASTPEEYLAKRRKLTADFGSLKKNKLLEASLRRSVNDNTLSAMTETAFSSPNIGGSEDSKQEVKADGALPDISLLQKAESSVLPKPNPDAKRPSEVYTLNQFLPISAKQSLAQMEEEAIRYFNQFDTVQKRVESGVTPIVAKRVGNPLSYPNPGRRAFFALKTITLSRLVTICFADRNQYLSLEAFDTLSLPPTLLTNIRMEYFGVSKRTSGPFLKVSINQAGRHKLLSHFLCLMLLFDDPEYILPVSPLVIELQVPEQATTKLLVGLGCVIATATKEEAIQMNTIKVARLLVPSQRKSNTNRRFSRK